MLRALLVLLCACVALHAAAQPAAPRRVLVLVSTSFGNPGIDRYIGSAVHELNRQGVALVDIHVEYLDLIKYPQPPYRARMAQTLAAKYAGLRFDAVIAMQQPALNFILHEGRVLAPAAPVVAGLASIPPEVENDERQFVFQLPRLDYGSTLQRALELFPATRHVIVLSGVSEMELARLDDSRHQLAPWRGRLDIRYTTALSMADAGQLLAQAAPDTVAIGTGYSRDVAGGAYIPSESLVRMAARTRAPVFTFYETSMGPNVMGGMMPDIAGNGAAAARAALTIAPRQHLSLLDSTITPYFDWTELQRWHADPARLPANTVFIHRPATLWSQYRYFVLASACTIVLLLLLLCALLWEARRRRRAERALAAREAHYRRQIEFAPEAIVLVDFDQQRIVDANPSAERLFGVSRAEMTRNWISHYYAPVQPDGRPVNDSLWANLERAQAGHETVLERHIVTADGRLLHCEVRVAGMDDPRGRVTRSSFIDITARQRQEQLTRQLLAENQTILRNVIVGISHVRERRFVSCNRRLEELFGYGPGEMTGQPTSIYYDTEQAYERAGAEIYGTLASQPHYRTELLMRRRDGSQFWAEVAGGMIDPAHPEQGSIWIYSDISERRHAERELLRHRDHLEELVGQRTAAMMNALDQAEAANRAKSSFLSNISHELRTPLNAVIGLSRLMARADTLTAEQRRNLDIINRAGSHLLTLINDVLTLSQIDAGQAPLAEEDVAPVQLLGDVVELLRARAEQAGLALLLDADALPAAVRVDAIKLRQVLLNLVSNAIKFTPRGSVCLHARAAHATDGRVALRVQVIDSGIGIAAHDQQRIFEPFVQMDTPLRTAGTGLGLAISRRYIALLGGELTLRSAPGAGATFSFTLQLPLADAPAATLPPAPLRRLAPPQQGRRVLVVDDQPEARLLLCQLLQPLGLALAEAGDGLEAVALAASFQPELILMDWRMPGIDGLEAVRRIRAAGSAPHIVMLSATAFDEQQQRALSLGVQQFLCKPLDEAALYDALERGLGLRFETAASPTAAAPPLLTRAALAVLSEDVRAALRAAVQALNLEHLAAVVAQIGEQHADLASAIGQMTEAFQCRELEALLLPEATPAS